jgi:hypothetical protein
MTGSSKEFSVNDPFFAVDSVIRIKVQNHDGTTIRSAVISED